MIMLQRLAAAAGAVLFGCIVYSTIANPGVSLVLKLIVVAIAGVTIVRPFWGACTMAVVLPLSTYVWAYTDRPFDTATVAEMLLAPFLLGAVIRRLTAGRDQPLRLAPAAWVLGSVIAASALIELLGRQLTSGAATGLAEGLWRHASTRYFNDPDAFLSLHGAVQWIEALTLAVLMERLVRAHPRGARAIVIAVLTGGTAAALTTWRRFVEISLHRPRPLHAAIGFLHAPRINTLYTDVNAAGSLFAIYTVAAAWLAIERSRAEIAGGRPEQPVWRRMLNAYWLLTVIFALPLWLTHSRAALGGTVLALAALWVVERRPRWRTIAAAAGAAAAILVALVLASPKNDTQSSSADSMRVRLQMAHIGLQIAREHPWFGVGLGQFRASTPAYMTPDLLRLFPQTAVGENAHNNFIQILAELGIVGLAAFVWIVSAAGRSAARAIAGGDSARAAIAGLAGGLLAFLLSCLLGHPLLISEVLWLFMLIAGVTTGLGAPVQARARSTERLAAAALGLVVIGSIPVRYAEMSRTTNLSRVVLGAGPVVDAGDGSTYRVAEPRSTWFVPSSAHRVDIPVRLTVDSHGPCSVHVSLDGLLVNEVTPVANAWSPIVLLMSSGARLPVSRRVDLVTDGDCRLMVGEFRVHE